MNPCVVLVCVFCSGMELIELFMNANDGGRFQEAIFDTQLTQMVFYSLFLYALFKVIVCIKVHKQFKLATLGYSDSMIGDDDEYQRADQEQQ